MTAVGRFGKYDSGDSSVSACFECAPNRSLIWKLKINAP